MLTPGHPLPALNLADHRGNSFDFNALKNKYVFIYFYPKASTPGCTVQSIAMSNLAKRLDTTRAVVLGISPDKPTANAKFCQNEGLTHTLLSDTEHTVAEAFGVWAEKSMYGKKYMGLVRSTFVFGPDHALLRVIDTPQAEKQALDTVHSAEQLGLIK